MFLGSILLEGKEGQDGGRLRSWSVMHSWWWLQSTWQGILKIGWPISCPQVGERSGSLLPCTHQSLDVGCSRKMASPRWGSWAKAIPEGGLLEAGCGRTPSSLGEDILQSWRGFWEAHHSTHHRSIIVGYYCVILIDVAKIKISCMYWYVFCEYIPPPATWESGCYPISWVTQGVVKFLLF